jgi:hypothetical protein
LSTEIREWAPIALFLFKRPAHTRRVIESLRACQGFAQSPVYVFADGPRGPEDVASVHQTRAEARRLLGEKAVYVQRETNLGVDRSIIAGVTQLCERYGRVVVVEEDLQVSPYFLAFLNAGLQRYEERPQVMQVCGYMYDVPQLRDRSEAIFLPMTSSLGWATWKRAWDQFDPKATGWRELLSNDRDRKRFDLDGNRKYAKMLEYHMGLRVPAWDIRWYYSVFVRNGLVLFPPRTLVVHDYDGTGTHDRFSLPVHQAQLEMNTAFDLPDEEAETPAKEQVFEAARTYRPSSGLQKAIAVLKYVFRRMRRPRSPRIDQAGRVGEQEARDDRGSGHPVGRDR